MSTPGGPGLTFPLGWVQVLRDAGDPAPEGLPEVARLLALVREAGPEDRHIHPEISLGWRSFKPEDVDGILAGTLEGSRDLKALQVALPRGELLAPYRIAPPPHWLVAEAGGDAVGCLLLDGREDGGMTLRYMGVLPAERGRRLGRSLMRRGIEEAAAGGFPAIHTLVDEANAPAKVIYFAHGFKVAGKKVLHFGKPDRTVGG